MAAVAGESMNASERDWWRIALELRLRRSSGDQFQDFFSNLMSKLHGDDFVRVRPFGALGDKGCDGYLQSGDVFQCYGAVNGDGGKVAYLVSKMEDDFSKAQTHLAPIMTSWHMVHNLVDGLPTEAVLKLKSLGGSKSTVKCAFLGFEGLQARLFKLDSEQIESLLGIAANRAHLDDFRTAELSELITGLVKAVDEATFGSVKIGPVPVDKLSMNHLPGHWCRLIEGGWMNAHLVAEYTERHSDPMIGERLATVFRERYLYLKAQNLMPGAIMSSLYDMICGPGTVSPARQVVAQALLAYLFESCDIFEDKPGAAT